MSLTCLALPAEDVLPLLARPAGLRFLARSLLEVCVAAWCAVPGSEPSSRRHSGPRLAEVGHRFGDAVGSGPYRRVHEDALASAELGERSRRIKFYCKLFHKSLTQIV